MSATGMSAVMEELERRLADGGIVLLDGGMGTEIQARGVPMDDEAWSARANITHPEVVRQIHEDYLRAGAEVLIANTFPAGAAALAVPVWATRSPRSTRPRSGSHSTPGNAPPIARSLSPARCP
jgi:S-methylmethionine-dependent homocysteine/selenocysteine methylase